MKRTLLFFFLGLTANHVFAQNTLDSLRSAYNNSSQDSVRLSIANQLSRAYAFIDPDSAKQYGLIAISLAQSIQDENELANAKLNTAVSYHVVGEFEKAITYYREVYDYRLSTYDSIGISAVLNNLGAAYASTGNFPKALDILQKSLEIKTALKQLDKNVTTLANIGNIYFGQESFDQALSYYIRSLEISNELGNTSGSFRAYNNIGLTFLELKKSDSALYYYRKSEELYDGTNPCVKTFMLDGLSQVFFDKSEFQLSKEYALELLKISKDCGDPEKETSALTMLGKIELSSGNVTLGVDYLEKAATIAQKIDQRQNLIDISNLLYGYHKSSGQHAKALEYLETYTQEKDSLNNAALTKELTKVELQFKFDQELDSIAFEQRIAETIYQQEIAKRQTSLYIAFVILTLLIITITVLYLYYKNKAKLNQQLQLQNEQIRRALDEREVLMREIHHRVKNNLQVVSSLLNIQSKLTTHEDAKDALTESRNRVLTMAMIHQKLYRSEDLTDISLKEYVEEIASSVLSSHRKRDENITLNINIEEIGLELDRMINIGLIINELITNSLKHAFKGLESGSISVNIMANSNQLQLEVVDTGQNNTSEIPLNSYGQRLIISLVAGMKGEISTTTTKGTSTFITLPIK